MTTEDREVRMAAMRKRHHPRCFVCGECDVAGLGVDVHDTPDGAVVASFACDRLFQGYSGLLHGGVICSLLDGMMTNCMFAHGRAAVTVDLKVRFRHPVHLQREATVRAWLDSVCDPLYLLKAELRQEGRVAATAEGRFIDRPEAGPTPDGRST